jgi:acetamidase/formamidase
MPGTAIFELGATMNRHAAAALFTGVSLSVGTTGAHQDAVIHQLAPQPSQVVHGYYAADIKPAIRLASGDILDVETAVAATPDELVKGGLPAARIPSSLRALSSTRQSTGPVSGVELATLAGPVYIEDAELGDTLEVRILKIDLQDDFAYSDCPRTILSPSDCEGWRHIVPIDKVHRTAAPAPGVVIPLQPFFANLGVAPAETLGHLSSTTAAQHGGNLGDRSFGQGTILYLPVFVRGALFEVGDGHAAQGDGSVDRSALLTSLRGRLQFVLHKHERAIQWPRAETATAYLSIAADPDPAAAAKVAILGMVDYLSDVRGLTGDSSYRLISIAGNVSEAHISGRSYVVQVSVPKALFGR